MAEAVLYQQQDNVVIITLNRPEALNAINRQLRQELGEALVRFDQDPSTRVAIITGAGRAFCAGLDLKERAALDAGGVQSRSADRMTPERTFAWPRTSKPLIAAINGYAIAGGWSIAQMCDLRLAAQDARLSINEAQRGLIPPFTAELTKLIPMAAVLELVLTAEPISAQRAHEIGFVNRVVPGERLMEEAMSMARSIADNAPLSIKHTKELAYRALDLSNTEAAALTYQIYDQLLLSEDSKEGPRAFAEKRKPQWQGR